VESEEKNIEQVEKYLLGELSEEETANFEKKALKDKELTRLCDEMRLLIYGIKYSGRQENLKALRELEKTLPGVILPVEQKKKVAPIWSQFGIAASVLLIIGSIVHLLFPNNGNEEDKLFEAYYTIYPNLIEPVTRGEGKEPDKGFGQYEQGNYEKAIELFTGSLSEDHDGNILFYLGLSCLEAGKYQQGVIYLQEYLQNYNTFIDQAHWYLALGGLKTGDFEMTKKMLETLASGSSSYSDKAKEMQKSFRER